jgi:hypothetical protein
LFLVALCKASANGPIRQLIPDVEPEEVAEENEDEEAMNEVCTSAILLMILTD